MREAPEDCLFLQVPAGIGDFSWIYSKLVTLGRPLRVEVCGDGPARALPYMELLPMVDQASYSQRLSTREVLRLGKQQHLSRQDLIDRASGRPLPIQLNTHLENGRRVEEYLPELDVEHHYPISIPDSDVAAADDQLNGWDRYLTFYCANTRTVDAWGGWKAQQWAEMASLMANQYQVDGIVLVGAVWDEEMSRSVAEAIGGAIPVRDLTGKLSVGGSLEVIRRGGYFVAFPSGMPILASVMNSPVMMFYPPHLSQMQTAWPDPDLVENGHYKGCQFCEPSRAFDWVRSRFAELPGY